MRDKKTYYGVVTENLPGLYFKVRMESTGKEIKAYISGKMFQNHIKVLISDKVEVVLSPDGNLGRIVRRL